MDCGITPRRSCIACAVLGLAGCATTRHAPPEVVTQPQQITTREAAAAGLAAAHAGRYGPPDLTVEDVRNKTAQVPPPLTFAQRLDQKHDQLYTWVQSAVEATDHRFAGKDRELKPVPAAPFRIGAVFESIDRVDGNDAGFNMDLDLLLRLPNVENKLHVFITSNDLDEAPRSAQESTALRAGVRYPFRRYLQFDVGVRLDVPPVAFTAVRWTREYQLGDWDFYPFLKLFAETKESFGYAAAATLDRWSGRRLLRSSTYAKWRHDRNATEWTQSFVYARANQLIVPDRFGSYLQARDIGSGWGVRLLASGERATGVTYYEASVFYRHPTASRWLFWSVEPLVRWDRQYAWHTDPGLRVGINALFWDLARPAP
jgi:hypothetical protein